MAGNISDFLAHINEHGVVRASHFELRMATSGFVGKAKIDPHTLTFRCETAELPGRQLLSSDIKIYGPSYKTPFNSLYAESTFTFLETGTMEIRTFFEDWMDSIFDSKTNRLTYPNFYRQDITVSQYDLIDARKDNPYNGIAGGPKIEKDDRGQVSRTFREVSLKPLLSVKFIQAFPTNINQMVVAWQEESFHRVAVTFAYERYEYIPTIPTQAPTQSQSPQEVPNRVADYSGSD